MRRLRAASESQFEPPLAGGPGRRRASSEAGLLEEGEGERALVRVDQVADYRFLGTIVTVKTKEAYGFIRSDQLETDIFFGLNHCTPGLREGAASLIHMPVRFTVQHNGKRSLGARHVEAAPAGWEPVRLRGRLAEWAGEAGLLQVTSGSGLASIGNRLWCGPEELPGPAIGLGAAVTFLLGVGATVRPEARALALEAGPVAQASAGEELVAVKQVTSDEFSGDLIAEMGRMDAVTLNTVFDKQLRQRLVVLVTQPVGSRVVTAMVLRAKALGCSRLEDKIARMVMTNFGVCCNTKPGCTVVQTCLECFSQANRQMVAEQLLEMDSVEQFMEFWVHARYVAVTAND
jgi:hypothetical protein